MKTDNPSVLNNEVQKYVNDILKEVYSINTHSISDFGSDLDSASSVQGSNFIEEAMTDTELSFRSTINGLQYRDLYLFKNYLKNYKQSSITKYYYMPLNGSKVVGSTVATTITSAIQIDGLATLTIDVPDGYNGNTAFVKVVLDDNSPDALDGSGGTTEHDNLVAILDNISSDTRASQNALLYYASDLHEGSFGIEIAKSTASIQVNINSSGLSGSYETEPNLVVKVVYFKRGVK